MPPKKRCASADPQFPPTAKKPKAVERESSFPNFVDGDVIISLHDLGLKLHRKKLRDTCDYFAKFAVLPGYFDLGSSCSIMPVEPVDSAPIESHLTVSVNPILKHTRAANEAIFRLLYRQPLVCTSPRTLFDTALLATRYGCVDTVKDALTVAILEVNHMDRLSNKDPWSLLIAGYNLQSKSIFLEALPHVVGSGMDSYRRVPDAIAALVNEHRLVLRDKINRCWKNILYCCMLLDGNLPRALAAVQMLHYLQMVVGYSSDQPLSTEVYHNLVQLRTMKSVRPILHSELMTSVEVVATSMKEGEEYLQRKVEECYDDGDEEGYDDGDKEEEMGEVLRKLNVGIEEDLNRHEIEKELVGILGLVQIVLAPLFDDSRSSKYFTCVEFKGPFPWETLPASSS